MGCVESREHGALALRLPRFILLGSFSDTLFAVSIVGIVYVAICSRFCGPGGVISMGCVESREHGALALRLPRFILLGSFSDTLLAVSIVGIVYVAICSRFCSPDGVIGSPCGNYGSFLAWG